MNDDDPQGTCQVLVATIGDLCGQPATYRYPALDGSYMHLCEGHGIKHSAYSQVWQEARWIGTLAVRMGKNDHG